jgi:ferredoxin-NADP reductase
MEQSKVTSKLKLITSHDEIDNVRTFLFDAGGLTWVAGQSQGYVLPEAGVTEKENQHWFTISSAPSEKTINISTRVSKSAFKQTLNAMKPGDEIGVHSLGGDFIWEESEGTPVVLVAAGIGITPFRSILHERKALGKPLNATLLYFNRTVDIPFEKELKKLSQEHSKFILKSIVGEPVTADKILELAPQANKQTVYLSGPAPMVSSVGKELLGRGVVIKQDWFPGYDEKNY